MAIDFTTVFTKFGKIFGGILTINGFRGQNAPSPSSAWGSSGSDIKCLETLITDIQDEYASSDPEVVDGIRTIQATYEAAHSTILTSLKSIAEQTLLTTVNKDTPQNDPASISQAMTQFVAQMVSQSKTVKANTVSASISVGGSNIGNAKVIASIIGPDGKNLEYVIPEALTLKVTADRFTGGTQGKETISMVGESIVSDKLSFEWPGGSGFSSSISVIDYAEDAGTNVLINSDFSSFTSHIPNSWAIETGTAGTTVDSGGSPQAFGTSSDVLKIIGNGSELTCLTQLFGQSSSTTGTTVTLKAGTVYAMNAWVKVSAVPAAGVLAFELANNSTDAVLTNDQSTACRVSVALTGLTTSYAAVNGFFQTPTNLPDNCRFQLRLSTALENGKSAYIGGLALAEMTNFQLYDGGPYVAVFRGSTDLIKNDTWTVTVANNGGGIYGAMTGGKIQTMFDVCFDMKSLGLQLPSSGSPNISESLVS